MAQLTSEERKVIVEEMIKNNSPTKVRRYLLTHHQKKVARSTIIKIFKKWNDRSAIRNLNKGNSGRKKTVRSDENIESVKQAVSGEPTMSVRKLAFGLDLKMTSVRTILSKDLKFIPYKLQSFQKLHPEDPPRRLNFCKRIKEMSSNGEIDIENVIFSDECHIYLHGMMNKQNFRNWLPEKPQNFFEKPLHSPKITVWCGMSSHKIYGPYFFEFPETEQACPISSETYVAMLEEVIPEDCSPDEWFQQDGATAHTSNVAMEWLRNRFPEKLISHRSSFPWPPRSPDLSPLDFFLWGFVKEKVFRAQPSSIQELKTLVQRIINEVDCTTLERTIQSFTRRVEACIGEEGDHFQNKL